jgi:catechol 2,3-dioxygenase-like lactoylglutathione lyase family enzyme
MDQRLNIITLGVDDVPRARAFYERLGWEHTFTHEGLALHVVTVALGATG